MRKASIKLIRSDFPDMLLSKKNNMPKSIYSMLSYTYERRDIKNIYIHSFVQKNYGKDKPEAKEKDYYSRLNCGCGYKRAT